MSRASSSRDHTGQLPTVWTCASCARDHLEGRTHFTLLMASRSLMECVVLRCWGSDLFARCGLRGGRLMVFSVVTCHCVYPAHLCFAITVFNTVYTAVSSRQLICAPLLSGIYCAHMQVAVSSLMLVTSYVLCVLCAVASMCMDNVFAGAHSPPHLGRSVGP